MDYVSNNTTIVKDQRADRGAVILAYDMAFTKLKKSNGKEKKKLRVMLSNVPDFIKVISVSPSKVDYIIQK